MTDYNNAVAASGLFDEHVQAWAELYASGIEIEGQLPLAQAVNTSVYSLLSALRADWPYSTGPGGLTDGYNGHTFWDMETWMFPPLAALYPSIASSALLYRANRLAGAQIKAAVNGYAGAMFPWEDAFSGLEAQASDGKVGPWGQYEQHISGDIAFAVQQFLLLGAGSDGGDRCVAVGSGALCA